MTTNPTPLRGEVWRIKFDPAEGDEIKKVRTAVVISENAIGRLKLKIVVPSPSGNPGMRLSLRAATRIKEPGGRLPKTRPSWSS
jgi:mRNA-degrading endonuclease toxin of MazEF toxin-antitoxin module